MEPLGCWMLRPFCLSPFLVIKIKVSVHTDMLNLHCSLFQRVNQNLLKDGIMAY